MKRIKAIEAALARAEGWLLIVLVYVMVILAFTQVILRQIASGWLWADTLLRHLVLWVAFLGAALASANDKHFSWEACVSGLSGRGKVVCHLIAQIACATVCALLTQAAYTFLLQEKLSGTILFTIGVISVPAWIMILIIPVGFMLVLIHAFLKALHATLELVPS